MTPGSFDTSTCRALIGDARARVLEADARSTADRGAELARADFSAGTYWDGVREEAEWRVARAAYEARVARIARKKAAEVCS